MKSNEVRCMAMSADEWSAWRNEQRRWREEQQRVSAEAQQMLSEYKIMVEGMKKVFAEERRDLDDQRASMEEQRRVDAEAKAVWDLEREEDVRRIAKTSAALTKYCGKCCGEVTKSVEEAKSVKVTKPVERAEPVTIHVVPPKKDVRTYAEAVSEPLGGQEKTSKMGEGVAHLGGAAKAFGCMRCGEQGHQHWSCFGQVHESRLWGRDPKRRRKRWRRSDANVNVISERVKAAPDTVCDAGLKMDERGGADADDETEEPKEAVLEMAAPPVVVSVVRGHGHKRSSGDSGEVTLKTNERQGVGASGGTMELKEVAFQETMRRGRGGRGRGGCDRFGSVRREEVGYHT